MKVYVRLSFTRLVVIRQINRVQQISTWKMPYENSVAPSYYLNLLDVNQFFLAYSHVCYGQSKQ